MQQNFGNDQKVQDALNTLEAQAGVSGNNAQAGQAKYDADYAARMAGAYAQNPAGDATQAAQAAQATQAAQDGASGAAQGAEAAPEATAAAAAQPQAQVRDPHAAAATAAYAQTQSYGGTTSKAAFNANGNPQDGDKNVANSSAPNFAELEAQYQQQGQSLQEDDSEDEDIDIGDEVDAEALEAEVNQLQGQLEIMKKTLASEHDKMLRAVAEVENIRKRTEQEIERERKFALERFVRSLLPIYDALEQALKFSDPENEATRDTYNGVKQTLDLFLKEMGGFGVELIDPTGKPFDPNFHQAISMVPDPNVPNGHVASTMQKGFTLNGRVVRPAMVVVCKS